MVETIIAFLTSNKAVIGVIVSIGEGIVVLINLWKKFKPKKKGKADSMSASPSFSETLLEEFQQPPADKLYRTFLWAINPINCFRKIK